MRNRTIVVIIWGICVVAGAAYFLSPTETVPPPESKNEVFIKAYTTGYTFWDNTPPGSATIAFEKRDGYPTLHDVADGIGTYEDPITVAVGHVITNVHVPDYEPGTRFYVPHVRRYFIVEDLCGDGATPQNIPCHRLTPEVRAMGAEIWLDLWIDGATGNEETVQECADIITGNGAHLVILNPKPGYVVVPGSLFANGACTELYDEEPLTLPL